MTEEAKKDDVNELVSKINAKIEEKMKKDDEKMGMLSSEIAKLSAKPAEKEDFIDDDDDDSSYITKKDLKSFARHIYENVNKTAEKTSKEITIKTMDDNSVKNSRDVEAFREFPQMDSSSKYYDPNFRKAVEAEISLKGQRGRTSSDPDLLYDSAANIFSKWVKESKITPRSIVDDQRRINNNKDDDFSVTPRAFEPNPIITDEHVKFAANFGMSKERLKEITEKYGKRG